jgi:hypothetical protein
LCEAGSGNEMRQRQAVVLLAVLCGCFYQEIVAEKRVLRIGKQKALRWSQSESLSLLVADNLQNRRKKITTAKVRESNLLPSHRLRNKQTRPLALCECKRTLRIFISLIIESLYATKLRADGGEKE